MNEGGGLDAELRAVRRALDTSEESRDDEVICIDSSDGDADYEADEDVEVVGVEVPALDPELVKAGYCTGGVGARPKKKKRSTRSVACKLTHNRRGESLPDTVSYCSW